MPAQRGRRPCRGAHLVVAQPLHRSVRSEQKSPAGSIVSFGSRHVHEIAPLLLAARFAARLVIVAQFSVPFGYGRLTVPVVREFTGTGASVNQTKSISAPDHAPAGPWNSL